MACDIGMHYPKKLGGIIGVSGYIYFFDNWTKKIQPTALQTPWLITHGTQDDALEIDQTREHVKKLLKKGFPIPTKYW